MLEQQHLNLVVSVMRRLQSVSGSAGEAGGAGPYAPSSAKSQLSATAASSDKLATLMQYLLDCLLTLSLPIPGMAVSTTVFTSIIVCVFPLTRHNNRVRYLRQVSRGFVQVRQERPLENILVELTPKLGGLMRVLKPFVFT